MKNEMTPGVAVAAVFGGFASIILMIVWGGLLSALALSLLWGWFIVPLFGLPALSLLSAYGMVLAFRVARGVPPHHKNEDGFGKVMAKAFFNPALFYGLFILCGWIAKSFM